MQLVEEGRNQNAERGPGHETTAQQPHKIGVDDEERQVSTSPRTRGTTSTSIGLRPRVRSASISSLTCIVPICAVKALPERPAMMIASTARQFAQDRDAEQVDRVDLGAEPAQLIGAR